MTDPNPTDAVAAVALLGEPTRRRLYDYVIGQPEPVGRDKAAAALGISRELAAFHLDRLLGAGLLEAQYRRLGPRRGPGGGRPTKLYRRAQADVQVSLPARDYQRLADDFATALSQLRSGPSAAAEVARTRGEVAGEALRRGAGPRPSRRRLESALVSHLQAAGYEPTVDPRHGTIRLANCPYRATAESHRPLTCGANLAWAEGLLARLGDDRLNAEMDPVPGQCCVVFQRRD